MSVVETIKKIICSEFGITIEEMHSKDRHQRVAIPRHVFFYLVAKIYPNFSLNDLGALMPLKKHHSTIIHSKIVVENLIFTGYLSNNIKNIEKELKKAFLTPEIQ